MVRTRSGHDGLFRPLVDGRVLSKSSAQGFQQILCGFLHSQGEVAGDNVNETKHVPHPKHWTRLTR
jgi:hypothetical protein